MYQAIGDYDKAFEYYSNTLSVKLNILRARHPEVAQAYNDNGMLYMEVGDIDKAMEYQFYAMNAAMGSSESTDND